MGILACPPGRVKSGEVFLHNQDILKMSEINRRELMGRKIAIVFQDSLSHLNPVFSVGSQIAECFEVHKNFSKKKSWEMAVKLLERVNIPNASNRAKDFPHQFSGGQRQRVMIAMALALEPDIIIADEPTTALDVTIQSKILELLVELRDERNMGLILITHDLGIAAEIADNVIVLKDGQIVEKGSLKNVFLNPKHTYTKTLMNSLPGNNLLKKKSFSNKKVNPILSVQNVSKYYDIACV
jgi:ABC-type dipeptide/oligopeptide/nickel transport system ATPase component